MGYYSFSTIKSKWDEKEIEIEVRSKRIALNIGDSFIQLEEADFNELMETLVAAAECADMQLINVKI